MVKLFTALSQKPPQKSILFFVLYYQQKKSYSNVCAIFMQKCRKKSLSSLDNGCSIEQKAIWHINYVYNNKTELI
jgi:hypothetical protein